jgi:hypothetical protein
MEETSISVQNPAFYMKTHVCFIVAADINVIKALLRNTPRYV